MDDRPVFDRAADAYDAARPDYPSALYDLLASRSGGLAGRVVVDAGAGTGVASRQLAAWGSVVLAVDLGAGMRQRARRRSENLRAVMGDAGVLPLRSASADLVCAAQARHWVDQLAGAAEAARVLRTRGWWAAWWNHPWADSEPWFDHYYGLLERHCPGVGREQRHIDRFGTAITEHPGFAAVGKDVIPWTRTVSVEDWILDLTSHSYVIALAEPDRTRLLFDVEAVLRGGFPDGMMSVAYETRLLTAQHL